MNNETTQTTTQATIEFYPNPPSFKYGYLIYGVNDVCSVFNSRGVTYNGVHHNYTIAKNKYGKNWSSNISSSVVKTYSNAIYTLYNLQYVVKMGFDGSVAAQIHIKDIDDPDCYNIKTDGTDIYVFFKMNNVYVAKKIDPELKTLTVIENPFPDNWTNINIATSLNVVGDEIFSLVCKYKHENTLRKRIEIFDKKSGSLRVIDQYQDGDEMKFFNARNDLRVVNLNYAVMINNSDILLINISCECDYGRVVHSIAKPYNYEGMYIVGPDDFNIGQ